MLRTSPTISGSSALVGSSKSIRSGFMDSARHSHTLLLTTGQLEREAVFLPSRPTLASCSRATARLSPGTAQNLNLSDRAVIQNVQVAKQVELLEHHTHVGTHAVNVSTSGSVTSVSPTMMVPSFDSSSRFTQRSRVDYRNPKGR